MVPWFDVPRPHGKPHQRRTLGLKDKLAAGRGNIVGKSSLSYSFGCALSPVALMISGQVTQEGLDWALEKTATRPTTRPCAHVYWRCTGRLSGFSEVPRC